MTNLELSECTIMNHLRYELDRRGIEYRDDSSVIDEPFDYRHVILRTKWNHHGEEVSVIWGYFDRGGERMWMTYGAPERLECWYRPNDPDPIPMTLDEILEMCV